jgi:DNA polymerase V
MSIHRRLPRPRRRDTIAVISAVEIRSTLAIPLVLARLRCGTTGFPSPADDYLERPLDFNQLLIENVPATFAARVEGDSMIGIGICPGDIAVIDRSRRAVDRSIVLALVDGEFTLKRYRTRLGRVWLQPENPACKDIEIGEGMAFEVWGVLTGLVRKY